MPCTLLAIPDRSAKEADRAKVQPGGWNASQNGVAVTTGPLEKAPGASREWRPISDLKPKCLCM